MTPHLAPADKPTFYFVGVTTGSSSIMKVFPAWAAHLGLDAAITGIDLPLDDAPENYRAVVEFLKNDPLSLGSLVTSHKLNLYKAATRPVRPGRVRHRDPRGGQQHLQARHRAVGPCDGPDHLRAVPRSPGRRRTLGPHRR